MKTTIMNILRWFKKDKSVKPEISSSDKNTSVSTCNTSTQVSKNESKNTSKSTNTDKTRDKSSDRSSDRSSDSDPLRRYIIKCVKAEAKARQVRFEYFIHQFASDVCSNSDNIFVKTETVRLYLSSDISSDIIDPVILLVFYELAKSYSHDIPLPDKKIVADLRELVYQKKVKEIENPEWEFKSERQFRKSKYYVKSIDTLKKLRDLEATKNAKFVPKPSISMEERSKTISANIDRIDLLSRTHRRRSSFSSFSLRS